MNKALTSHQNKQRGEIATIATLIGLGVMMLGIAIGRQVIQNRQDNRSNAAIEGTIAITVPVQKYYRTQGTKIKVDAIKTADWNAQIVAATCLDTQLPAGYTQRLTGTCTPLDSATPYTLWLQVFGPSGNVIASLTQITNPIIPANQSTYTFAGVNFNDPAPPALTCTDVTIVGSTATNHIIPGDLQPNGRYEYIVNTTGGAAPLTYQWSFKDQAGNAVGTSEAGATPNVYYFNAPGTITGSNWLVARVDISDSAGTTVPGSTCYSAVHMNIPHLTPTVPPATVTLDVPVTIVNPSANYTAVVRINELNVANYIECSRRTADITQYTAQCQGIPGKTYEVRGSGYVGTTNQVASAMISAAFVMPTAGGTHQNAWLRIDLPSTPGITNTPIPAGNKADLMIESVSHAVSGTTGVTINTVVKNIGGIPVSYVGAHEVRYNLQENGVSKCNATAPRGVSGLQPGASATLTNYLPTGLYSSCPSFTPVAGTSYTIDVSVDAANIVSESDETNNTKSYTFTQPGSTGLTTTPTLPPNTPDLAVTQVTHTEDTTQTIPFTITVENKGNAAIDFTGNPYDITYTLNEGGAAKCSVSSATGHGLTGVFAAGATQTYTVYFTPGSSWSCPTGYSLTAGATYAFVVSLKKIYNDPNTQNDSLSYSFTRGGGNSTLTPTATPALCNGVRHCADADSVQLTTCDPSGVQSCTEPGYTCKTYGDKVFTNDTLIQVACDAIISPPATTPQPTTTPGNGKWYAADGTVCDDTHQAGSNYSVYYTGPGCTETMSFRTTSISPQSTCASDGTGSCFIPTGNPISTGTYVSQWWYNGGQGPTQQCTSMTPSTPAYIYPSLARCSWGSVPSKESSTLIPAPPGTISAAGSGPTGCANLGGSCDTTDACHAGGKVVVANGSCPAAGAGAPPQVCCLPLTSLQASATSPFCNGKGQGFYKDPSDSTCYQCAGGLFTKADGTAAYGFPTDAAKCVENPQCNKQFGIINDNGACYYCMGTKQGDSYGYATECPAAQPATNASKEGNQGFFALMKLNSLGELTSSMFKQLFSFFTRTPGQLYEYWHPF